MNVISERLNLFIRDHDDRSELVLFSESNRAGEIDGFGIYMLKSTMQSLYCALDSAAIDWQHADGSFGVKGSPASITLFVKSNGPATLISLSDIEFCPFNEVQPSAPHSIQLNEVESSIFINEIRKRT